MHNVRKLGRSFGSALAPVIGHISGIAPRESRKPRLSLALQGGGSLGAFTWGVLDRLLEEEIAIDAVSGASAGAVNAVVLASGLMRDGSRGAREALAEFWKRASD